MSNGPARASTVFVLAAAMLLHFAAVGAGQTPVEAPKSALELGSPFVDNAVLQRQMPVPVWGWSEPGGKVTVRFAGQTKVATADSRLGTRRAHGRPRWPEQVGGGR